MNETTPFSTATTETPLLEISDLHVEFRTQGGVVSALSGVNIRLMAGETLAIVGESGSGKSTTAHAIINLLPGSGRISKGSIRFDGRDLTAATPREMEDIRGRLIGFVPQDPMSNLNPVWRIGFQVEEAIRANGVASGRKEVKQRAIDVLKEAGLADAESRLRQFPHQFSGGMRQRVLIGIGLSAHPKLLIADEPTSALDVTVQRVILDHLATMTRESNTAVLLITHDLGLAAERAEHLVVMHKGKVVESGPSRELLTNPQHPYTKRLVAAAPTLQSTRLRKSVVSEREQAAEGAGVALPASARAVSSASPAEPAIVVENLTKVFKIRGNGFSSTNFTAVDTVSFAVPRGTTTAIVGESGSGKSTVARMLLQLERPTSGRISIDGIDTSTLGTRELFAMRRRMQPVFQDPYGSLDPLRNIGNTIQEPLDTHRVGTKKERAARVAELLDQVSLPAAVANRYPNELSGGQRQRVAIARALALTPEIVILDEAVSALDVLVQAQILQLLAELQHDLGLTYLFITHNLAVVRQIADHVCVMQNGRIVEAARTEAVFDQPEQQYTRDLLAAIPGIGSSSRA